MESKIVSKTDNVMKYMRLDQKGSIMAEYVWIDGHNGLRSKTKNIKQKNSSQGVREAQTITKEIKSVEELPEWNFDGSSTAQAPGDNSDVYIRPVAMFPDPIRLSPNVIVMCETWDPDGSPNKFNYRHEAARLMEANKEHHFWFGLEQEYTLLDHSGWPYGWPQGGFPGPQGPYYCGVGTGK
ncbi:MAG: hypothetical protein LQ340_007781, partial [Diploschistes diacapsis]